jgi:hypothetical protein
MNVKKESFGDGKINYDLKILKLDQQRIINDVTNLHNDLNNNEKNIDELKNKYFYLFDNLPKIFNILIENQTMPLNMFIMMINDAYKIGKKETNPKETSLKLATELHKLYTNKKN